MADFIIIAIIIIMIVAVIWRRIVRLRKRIASSSSDPCDSCHSDCGSCPHNQLRKKT